VTEPQFSLVAELRAEGVVGHILFTPVEIRSSSSTSKAMGLGPMAVLPSCQRQGVGSALVEAGLAACRAAGELVLVVLGHPSYYPRFGFQPAWDLGLYYIAPGPNAAFMVHELERGALDGRTGEVLYHAAFDAL
jgi:putative acetyltransferase